MRKRRARTNGTDVHEARAGALATAVKPSFFQKLMKAVGHVPFSQEIIAMYFTMLDATTPVMVKIPIAVSLVYWISPIDLMPGIPVDDILGIGGALALAAAYRKPEHLALAKKALEKPQ